MKISHETPLSLLNESLKFNDYQYILPTFYNKYKEYKEFMLNYRKQNRSFIILDNGLFEGDNLNDSELLELIKEIKPDIFIVPDVWNNRAYTIVNAKTWFSDYKKLLPNSVNLMAVLQGDSYDDLYDCYTTLVDIGYKHIAFNHSSRAYTNFFTDEEDVIRAQTKGRLKLINNLIHKNIIDRSCYHHLLGASTWSEFISYGGMNSEVYNFIKSMDTSAPIINGILGTKFEDLSILSYRKPKQKLEEFMELEFNPEQMDCIDYNLKVIKSFFSQNL